LDFSGVDHEKTASSLDARRGLRGLRDPGGSPGGRPWRRWWWRLHIFVVGWRLVVQLGRRRLDQFLVWRRIELLAAIDTIPFRPAADAVA
jgi:hypothetical protein